MTPAKWFTLTLTDRQLKHLKMVCRFHFATSHNEAAIEETRKLLYCIERWTKERNAPQATEDV